MHTYPRVRMAAKGTPAIEEAEAVHRGLTRSPSAPRARATTRMALRGQADGGARAQPANQVGEARAFAAAGLSGRVEDGGHEITVRKSWKNKAHRLRWRRRNQAPAADHRA